MKVTPSYVQRKREKQMLTTVPISLMKYPISHIRQKPSTYDQFVIQINAACDEGDKDAKEIIEELVPEMAKFLKDHKEWDNPKVSVAASPGKVQLLSGAERNLVVDTNSVVDQTITSRLGPIPTSFSSPEPSHQVG